MLVWKGHRSKVRALAFAPGGGALASIAGDSRFVWLWEAHTGKLLRKLTNPTNGYPVRALAFTPDGARVIGLHERRCLSVWDANTGELVSVLNSGHWYTSEALAVSPNGARLLMYTPMGFNEWSDPGRAEPNPRAPDVHHQINTLAPVMGFSPLGTWFYRTSIGLTLFAANDLKTELRTLSDPNLTLPTAVAFASDESRVCVGLGHRARVWTLANPVPPSLHLKGHGAQVRAVGFSPDGRTVLTAAMDGTVRVWDANTGAEVRAFEWGIGKVRAAAVSPDGALCAAGSDSGHLVVWDADN
jgi:WD40 repeat protein